MKTIEERFQNYVKLCYGNKAPQNQIATVRMAWFACAFEILKLVVLEIAELSDDEAEAALEKLCSEVDEVCESMAKLSEGNN